jgi:phosphatidate cytidylyltransferase
MSMKNRNTKLREFVFRSVSTFILVPIVLSIIYQGGYPFKIFLSVIALAMLAEWLNLISKSDNRIIWGGIGLIYTLLPIFSILFIREHEKGFMLLLFLLLCVWATDIGAYILGSYLKGPKLAPKISPKKTWSGFLGGVLCATCVGAIFIKLELLKLQNLIYLSIVLSLFSQVGDLFESGLKRYFKVKDTGSIIPGHGGILDRVDSLVTAAPAFVAILLIF